MSERPCMVADYREYPGKVFERLAAEPWPEKAIHYYGFQTKPPPPGLAEFSRLMKPWADQVMRILADSRPSPLLEALRGRGGDPWYVVAIDYSEIGK